MILSFGQIFDTDRQDEILNDLEEKLNTVRERPWVGADVVISALDKVSSKIRAGVFDNLIDSLNLDNANDYKQQAIDLLKKENLKFRLEVELGSLEKTEDITSIRVPLGTIMHIAAGNADVLPSYSLIEGLMCGNINILKLPEADNGLTVYLLKMLVDMEPLFSDYIHVFDTPSSDIAAMLKMAGMSDAVSVWGGDAAIRSIRQMAPAGCEIIEWGHKLSFCYISTDDINKHEDELEGLAGHIISTRQLLCSSCQVIYLNTEDKETLDDFCRIFLAYLEKAASKYKCSDTGMQAEMTLMRVSEEIDHILDGESADMKRYQGNGCSITRCLDSELELSELWGNVLVKPLKKENMMAVLRRKKGYLQTAGLIADDDRDELSRLLVRCGINRVLPAKEMSASYPGESHDGKYPFERFTRIVNIK